MTVKNVIDFLYHPVGERAHECLTLCSVCGIIAMIIGVSMTLPDMTLLGAGLTWFCLAVVLSSACAFRGLYGNVSHRKAWLIGGWWLLVAGALAMLAVVMNTDSLTSLLFGVMAMWFVAIAGFPLATEMVHEVDNLPA